MCSALLSVYNRELLEPQLHNSGTSVLGYRHNIVCVYSRETILGLLCNALHQDVHLYRTRFGSCLQNQNGNLSHDDNVYVCTCSGTLCSKNCCNWYNFVTYWQCFGISPGFTYCLQGNFCRNPIRNLIVVRSASVVVVVTIKQCTNILHFDPFV